VKQNDKPFWGPVAALIVGFGLPFHPWPLHPDGPMRPTPHVVNGFPALMPQALRTSANDEIIDPEPEAA
jgi:hypothetical protein